MRRRDFIKVIGGTATAWPLAAHAQQAMRRIAIIMVQHETDALGQGRLNAFLRGFEKLGWRSGQNVRIDVRWAAGSTERMREIAADFVALKPDVIVVAGTPAVGALKRATSSIPIVFVGVNEPVAQGFIASMARPGGNITGFTQGDFSIIGKSIEMLKAIAPALNRVGLMYNPETYSFYDTYLAKIQAEARWSMELTRVAVRMPPDIEVGVKSLTARPGGGLAVLADAFNTINQETIRRTLEQYPLPHVVPWRLFVTKGGLMSYGPDVDAIFAYSADYVDRILKGTKPADLPAQNPTKYELVINLKTAKALGLDVAPSLLAIADHVIE
jgi:putative ABC transport system substrate-binding protein